MITTISRTAWLFPGQGSQEIGMGRAVLEHHKPAVELMCLAERLSGHPLREIIQRGPESTLVRTEILQPALVAVSLSYIDLLRSVGSRPEFVAGHSLGELSALHAAGVISAEDAIMLAVERGRLMSQAAEGGMLVVKDLPADRLQPLVDEVAGELVIANYNAPNQIVVSGSPSSIDDLVPRISEHGGSCLRLNVSGAWHSPLVSEAGRRFAEILTGVTFHPPLVPIVIGSTAQETMDTAVIKQAMAVQITSPVRWVDVTRRLVELGVRNFVEVGPNKVLRGLLRRNLDTQFHYESSGVDSTRFVKGLVPQSPAQQAE